MIKLINILLESIPSDVMGSFKIQDSLVREVWDDGKLKPKIRKKLLLIAQDFFNSLDLPEHINVEDITLTGSLSNYNWSKFSEFDLHLIMDFSKISSDAGELEFYRSFFMGKKMLWNQKHSIKIHGFPVEIYTFYY